MEGLGDILDEEVEAVIWNRRTPPSVSSALGALPAHEVENGRFCVSVSAVHDRIMGLFARWGWRAGDAQHWLAEDVEALAAQMANILSVSHLLLRVELVRNDACRKFHCDTVRARLICTYSGPGTEYGIVEERNQLNNIHTVPTGSPMLLKGKLWPGYFGQSVLHRSPPIEGTGVSRLVIVLNEAAQGEVNEHSHA
jgi:hypothetical protein